MAFQPEGNLTAYRLADERYPIFDGGGAMLLGGRWNSPGRRVIYAALTFAGAMLEVLVHTNTGRVPTHHAYIEISIPATVPVERLDGSTIPDWDAPGYGVSRAIGDAWYDSGRLTVLVVPSVVSQADCNVLIHQEHPDFLRIQASEPRPVRWDRRLWSAFNIFPHCKRDFPPSSHGCMSNTALAIGPVNRDDDKKERGQTGSTHMVSISSDLD